MRQSGDRDAPGRGWQVVFAMQHGAVRVEPGADDRELSCAFHHVSLASDQRLRGEMMINRQAAASVAAASLIGAVIASTNVFAQTSTPGLRIEHAAARVLVIPEARSDVLVTVQGGDTRLPALQVRTEGGVVVVEGGLERRIAGCYGIVFKTGPHRDQTMRVIVRGIGPLTLDRLPVITARVPMDASVTAGDAVWGEVGPSGSLKLGNKGCGDWTIADVRGPLSVALSGSGDARGGSAGGVHAAISGSGDLTLRDVAALDAAVGGSGDIKVGRVNGPVSARIAGSGDISVDGGRAPNIAASVVGSGDFRFGGEAGAVAARIAGSGDIRVAHATGPVSRSVAGSGDVVVGR